METFGTKTDGSSIFFSRVVLRWVTVSSFLFFTNTLCFICISSSALIVTELNMYNLCQLVNFFLKMSTVCPYNTPVFVLGARLFVLKRLSNESSLNVWNDSTNGRNFINILPLHWWFSLLRVFIATIFILQIYCKTVNSECLSCPKLS